MKRAQKIVAALVLLGFLGSLVMVTPARAQLVIAKIKGTVNKVDVARNRLEVVQEGNSPDNVTYVVIDGFTKVSHNNRYVDWKQIPVGSKIKVEGGMQWDMKMKAKKIWY